MIRSVDNSEWARAEVGGVSCWAAQQRAVEAHVRAHAGQTVLLAAAAPPGVVLTCRPGNAAACAAAVRALCVARGAALARALHAVCLALHAVCVTPARGAPVPGAGGVPGATATTSGATTCNGFRVRIVVLACGAHRALADPPARAALAAVQRRAAVLRARIDVALFAPTSDAADITASAVLGALAAASRDGHCSIAPNWLASPSTTTATPTTMTMTTTTSDVNSGSSNDTRGDLTTWLEGALAGPPPPPPRVLVAHEFQLWRPRPRRVLEAEAAERARRSAATALGHQRAAACAAAFGPQQHAPVLAQPTSCAYGLATRILADDPPLPLAPFPAIASATGEDAPTDTPIPRHACTVLGAVPAGEVHVTLERHATPLPARGTLLFVRTRADTFEFLWRAAATGEVDDTLAVRRRCGTVRAARVPGGVVVALAAAAPTPRRALFWAQTRDTARVDAFAAAAQRALGPPAAPLPLSAPFLVPRHLDVPPEGSSTSINDTAAAAPRPGPRLAVLSRQCDNPFLEPRAQPPRHDITNTSSTATAATATGGNGPLLPPPPPPHGHKSSSSSNNNKKHDRQGSRRTQRKQYVAHYPHKFSTPAEPPDSAPGNTSPASRHTSPATTAAAGMGSVPVLFLSSAAAAPSSPSTAPATGATGGAGTSGAPVPPGGSPLLCVPAGVSPRGMAPLQTPPVSPSLVPLPSPPVPLIVSPLVSPGATPLVTPSSSPRPYDTFYAPCLAPAPRGTCAIGPIPASAFAEHLPSISSVFLPLCPRDPSPDSPDSTRTTATTTTTSNSNSSNTNKETDRDTSSHHHPRRRPPAPAPPPPQQPVRKHSRRGADHTGDGGSSSDSGADDGPPPTPTPTTTTAEPP